MAGEGSRLGVRQVPATAQLREHCRQLDRASAWGGTLCVKLAKEKLRAADACVTGALRACALGFRNGAHSLRLFSW